MTSWRRCWRRHIPNNIPRCDLHLHLKHLQGPDNHPAVLPRSSLHVRSSNREYVLSVMMVPLLTNPCCLPRATGNNFNTCPASESMSTAQGLAAPTSLPEIVPDNIPRTHVSILAQLDRTLLQKNGQRGQKNLRNKGAYSLLKLKQHIKSI